MANNNLERHAALLHAIGLPAIITLQQVNPARSSSRKSYHAKAVPPEHSEVNAIAHEPTNRSSRDEAPYLTQEALEYAGLYSNVRNRQTPLVLSADIFAKLYEDVVAAFHNLPPDRHSLEPNSAHYFGPLLLGVTDLEKDGFDDTRIRTRREGAIVPQYVKDYAREWLSAEDSASDNFYFGYTHGQRIHKWRYPKECKDFLTEPTNWIGEIDQLRECTTLLRSQKRDCRRAYVVIPHLVVDSSQSAFHKPELVAPALITIHFRIEPRKRNGEEFDGLSAFAILRSQELSLFLVVNYWEIKCLLKLIMKELEKDMPKLKLGRIVMMSSLSYFHPGTVLLNKPELCTLTQYDIKKHMENLVITKNPRVEHQFWKMLKEFRDQDYLKIDVEWIKDFASELESSPEVHSTDLEEALSVLREGLLVLKENYPGDKRREELQREKDQLILNFFRAMGWDDND